MQNREKIILSQPLFYSGMQFNRPAETPVLPWGHFIVPVIGKLYIDLSFYEDLQTKLNAPGDFAMAYVVAHEVGHHIQNLNGTADKVSRLRQQVSEAEYNRYSVKMELQADFLAGVWAHHAQQKNILEAGDIEEALKCGQCYWG